MLCGDLLWPRIQQIFVTDSSRFISRRTATVDLTESEALRTAAALAAKQGDGQFRSQRAVCTISTIRSHFVAAGPLRPQTGLQPPTAVAMATASIQSNTRK